MLKDDIIAAYKLDNKLTDAEIGELVGCDKSYVNKTLRASGLKKKTHRYERKPKIFCRSCGYNVIDTGAKFCPMCGKKIQTDAEILCDCLKNVLSSITIHGGSHADEDVKTINAALAYIRRTENARASSNAE